jgi:acyl carrier protein
MVENVKSELRNIIANLAEIDVDQVTDNASFVSELGLHSMYLIEFLHQVEVKFGVTIPESALNELQSVEKSTEVVLRYLNPTTITQ